MADEGECNGLQQPLSLPRSPAPRSVSRALRRGRLFHTDERVISLMLCIALRLQLDNSV